MKVSILFLVCCVFFGLSVASLRAETSAAPTAGEVGDGVLAEAKRFVERSDKYLHHSRLSRGMKGYGLTVMAGTKIVRFEVKIVSVVTGWLPHQDVVLAKLSGLGLEKTGIISGMSGSPVYMKDPRDGKFKMIGAVAYGWSFQKEPLCGLQPITQMLAVGGAFRKPAGPATQPTTVPKKKPAKEPATQGATRPAGAVLDEAQREYVARLLNPRKIDFSRFAVGGRRAGRDKSASAKSASDATRLVPLATPLMVSGMSRKSLAALRDHLAPMGLVPVQSGGAGTADARKAEDAALVPGAGISIALVSGDADWYAVGTVTDRIGKRVLAFGHGFFGEGDLALPMGPAYIHTVVASQRTSFKLSSSLKITGATDRDEYVGVGGVIGGKADMIPMTVSVDWKKDGRKQTFRYRFCRHNWLSSILPFYLVFDSVYALRELPERHTVRYVVEIDYGKFGRYRAANVSTAKEMYDTLSDMSRPITAMMRNPFAKPRMPEGIRVDIIIEDGQTNASIRELKLDAAVYRPGDTITGKLTIRPTRQARRTVSVKFELPRDLPEGTYTLDVCDAESAVGRLQSEMPHKFDPETEKELFEAINRVVSPRADLLYLRLPLRRGGMALGERELPDLPPGKAAILRQADLPDTKTFTRSLVRTMPAGFVMSGSASATFRVQKQPKETLLRKE